MTPQNIDAQEVGYGLSAKDNGKTLGPFNWVGGIEGLKSIGGVAGPVKINGLVHLDPHGYCVYAGHSTLPGPTKNVTINNIDVRCVTKGLHAIRLYNIEGWTFNGGTILYQNPNCFGKTLAIKEARNVAFNGVAFIGTGIAPGPNPNDPDSYVVDGLTFTDCPMTITSQFVDNQGHVGHVAQSYIDLLPNIRNLTFTGGLNADGTRRRVRIEQKSAAPILNFHGATATRFKPTNIPFVSIDFVGGTALYKGDASGATFTGCTWNGRPI